MPKTVTATKEIVILLWRDQTIIGMVRGNGSIEYFDCKRMTMAKHEQLWNVENPIVPKGQDH